MEFLEEENSIIRRDLAEARSQRAHLSALLAQSEQENTRLRGWIDQYYYKPWQENESDTAATNSDSTNSDSSS